jgi:uncharacterized protein (UPF0332 family)
MTSAELENLVRIGGLKREASSKREFEGLLRSGTARLADAANTDLALESRFDLAYNAAHALALAALRRLGYRSENRHLVFQTLAHTAQLPASVSRVLSKCHERRNRSEYEGQLEVNERLVADLIRAAQGVLDALRLLPPPGE